MRATRHSRLVINGWTKLAARRARRRASSPSSATTPISGDQVALLERFAPGNSFADIGCMWRVDGWVSFRAEELGATSVTAFDAMAPTDRFQQQLAERSSKVRFVRGDAHLLHSVSSSSDDDRETSVGVDEVGLHDVVWCTGLMYHTPNPYLVIRNLLSITNETLILGTKTIPEVPGIPGCAVFFPVLGEDARRGFAPVAPGAVAPFDRTPWMDYANWWWGFSQSAFTGLVESIPGWRVSECIMSPWAGTDDNCHVVVNRVP